MIASSFDLQDKVEAGSPFVCSLSSKLRLALTLMPNIRERMTKIAHGVVQTITTTEGVAESLRRESLVGLIKALRQIDLRGSNMEILFKSYTFWNYELKCWHVLLEGPEETFWEQQHKKLFLGEG